MVVFYEVRENMQEVYKIIGNPIEMYFDGKYGQLIVDMKGNRVSLNIINDCKNKPRSVQNCWGKIYFPPKNASTTFQSKLEGKRLETTAIPKEFFGLSKEDQKAESANMFLRRQKPFEFYINAKYKNLINFVTDKYMPILITDIINRFDSVLTQLKLEDNWKLSEMQKPSWQYSNDYVDFKEMKNIPCSAANLSSYNNGWAKLTNGTDTIEIICCDLTDGNHGIQIKYNNVLKKPNTYNNKYALDKVSDRFRELLANTKISEEKTNSVEILNILFNQATIELGLNKNLYVDDVLLKMKQIAEVKGEQLQNNWENVAREKIRNEWATEMKD